MVEKDLRTLTGIPVKVSIYDVDETIANRYIEEHEKVNTYTEITNKSGFGVFDNVSVFKVDTIGILDQEEDRLSVKIFNKHNKVIILLFIYDKLETILSEIESVYLLRNLEFLNFLTINLEINLYSFNKDDKRDPHQQKIDSYCTIDAIHLLSLNTLTDANLSILESTIDDYTRQSVVFDKTFYNELKRLCVIRGFRKATVINKNPNVFHEPGIMLFNNENTNSGVETLDKDKIDDTTIIYNIITKFIDDITNTDSIKNKRLEINNIDDKGFMILFKEFKIILLTLSYFSNKKYTNLSKRLQILLKRYSKDFNDNNYDNLQNVCSIFYCQSPVKIDDYKELLTGLARIIISRYKESNDLIFITYINNKLKGFNNGEYEKLKNYFQIKYNEFITREKHPSVYMDDTFKITETDKRLLTKDDILNSLEIIQGVFDSVETSEISNVVNGEYKFHLVITSFTISFFNKNMFYLQNSKDVESLRFIIGCRHMEPHFQINSMKNLNILNMLYETIQNLMNNNQKPIIQELVSFVNKEINGGLNN